MVEDPSNLKYLNNAQYAEFKAEKDRYDELLENYKEAQESYEKDKSGNRGSSPKPPIKPTITLSTTQKGKGNL